MRILHWYPNYLGGGAVANVVLGLAHAQIRAGADVRIASADEGGEPVYGRMHEEDGLLLPWRPRRRVHVGPLALRRLPDALRAQVRAFAPDVVHAHAEFNPDNFWALGLGGHETLVVLSPHGAFDPGVFAKSMRRSKRLYVRLARRLVYSRLDSFHALSPREREQANRVAPDVPAYVLPQGGGPAARATPDHAASASSTTGFVFIGRLDVYTKGLDLLVRAFARVVADGPSELLLTLVGPDARGGRGVLETMASELGIAHALMFTGAVSGDVVARILDDADCVVLLSRHEGLSLAATEALVRGKPLILSSQTGHASYSEIADSPSVLIVPPEQSAIEGALRSAIRRRDDLRRLALDRRHVFEELFSWDRVARRHLEEYERLRSVR